MENREARPPQMAGGPTVTRPTRETSSHAGHAEEAARNWRWWGAFAGLLAGLFDAGMLAALGVTFSVNGRDVMWLIGVYFGGSFAVLGFLLGTVAAARRRDRQAAAVIQAQTETIAGARARVLQNEKLAALGQLAAAIAHEVRNPLGVIRSAAQGLSEGLASDDADGRRACSFITAEIDRLTNVVSSLLAFARPPRIDAQPVTVDALLQRARLLAGAELGNKPVQLRCDEPPHLPPVRADADLLCQVLLGLVVNAVEATPAGSEVRIDACAAADGVEIAVSDRGPGVAPELRERIFDPFFTTRPRGTGLGLAIAKQIVEAHGGRIQVGERAGGGARFAVYLPTVLAA
jgi:signal transduction histidine kinase